MDSDNLREIVPSDKPWPCPSCEEPMEMIYNRRGSRTYECHTCHLRLMLLTRRERWNNLAYFGMLYSGLAGFLLGLAFIWLILH